MKTIRKNVVDEKTDRATTALFYFVAACLILAGFLVIFDKLHEPAGLTALYLFSAAAGVVLSRELVYLIPKLAKLKVGGVEMEITTEVRNLKIQVKEILEELIAAQGAGASAKQEEAKLNEAGG